jgi:hypothetical protein
MRSSRENLGRTLFLVACVVSLAALASGQFETRSSAPVTGGPLSFAVADFNHDGKLDVATGTFVGQLAVLLGRGDGTFQPATYYKMSSAYSVAAGDFNNDGNIDLAVADRLGQNISILLGNGDGTFQSPVPFAINGQPTYLTVGDFNNDGNLDVVVCDSPYVSVLLGNGDGTLQAPLDNDVSFCSAAPGSVAVGDFNRDHNLDAVFAGSNSAGVLLGNGDGTFQPVVDYPAGYPISVAVGDLRNDGKLDLALTSVFVGVYVLLGNGDGTFQKAITYPLVESGAIHMADFNGDGNLDLAAAGAADPGVISVLLGNGDGTFQPAIAYSAGKLLAFLVPGDFNGDHKTDIVYSDQVGTAIDVLLNTGVVIFSPTTPLSFSPQLLGTTSTQNVTLTNTGTTALSITSMSINKPFQLGSGTTCGTSVAAGGNCTLSVTFQPTVIGSKTGLLVLSDSAPIKPQVIELSGTGTVISVSPVKLNFGDQKVGTKSPPQNVTVTNHGNNAVSVTSVKIIGGDRTDYFETNTCGSQIGPGASCTISVTFTPVFKGTRVAFLQIFDNGGASPQQVTLTGTGT